MAQDTAVKNILVTGQHGNGLYTLKDTSDFTIVFLGVTAALGPQRAREPPTGGVRGETADEGHLESCASGTYDKDVTGEA